jgi:pantoate--beta-alanine ligase
MRESDGLAMSSRNRRLSSEDRTKAVAIFEQLSHVVDKSTQIPFRQLERQAIENLLAAGFRQVDYVSIAEAATLEPASENAINHQLVVLAAAYLGEIRLIDNMLLPSS